jgi:hypothetical protein
VWWARCLHASSFSRAKRPEGLRATRERGRRSTAILLQLGAALRRPRRLLAVPGVRSHRQRAHQSGRSPLRRATIVRTVEPLRAARSVRSAAADGRPCGLLPFHTAPSAGPGIRGELILASTPATVRALPQPGTAPDPQSRSSLPRPMLDRGAGSMARGEWGGDKFVAWLRTMSGFSPVIRLLVRSIRPKKMQSRRKMAAVR